ncbi:MAG: hypothetical protein U0586_17320 [Candidatus Brocadiaceae bacterium]
MKKKFNEKKLTVEDLELNEVKNNSEINFHQVDCLQNYKTDTDPSNRKSRLHAGERWHTVLAV